MIDLFPPPYLPPSSPYNFFLLAFPAFMARSYRVKIAIKIALKVPHLQAIFNVLLLMFVQHFRSFILGQIHWVSFFS